METCNGGQRRISAEARKSMKNGWHDKALSNWAAAGVAASSAAGK